MSKKNNKNRTKAYVEILKENERQAEAERKSKHDKKDIRITTNKMLNEINDMSLNPEQDIKMNVEKVSKRKPKKFAKKHKAKKD
jgi:hypothetical protein